MERKKGWRERRNKRRQENEEERRGGRKGNKRGGEIKERCGGRREKGTVNIEVLGTSNHNSNKTS